MNAAAVTISSSIAGSGDLSLSAKYGARRDAATECALASAMSSTSQHEPWKTGRSRGIYSTSQRAPKDLKQVRDGRTKTTPRSHSRTACSGGKPYNIHLNKTYLKIMILALRQK